jgi:hypothetical protein
MLLDYGRNLEDVPLVLQYNKRDLSDPYALEELHRKLNVNGAAVFEAVATEDTGVLQTLSTLSKNVVRNLRGQQFSAQAAAKNQPADRSGELPNQPESAQMAATEAAAGNTPEALMEDAILREAEHPEANILDDLAASAQTALDTPWDELEGTGDPHAAAQLDSEFSIASVGEATRSGERSVRIPLVVSDKGGRTSNLVLTVRLDPLLDGDGD